MLPPEPARLLALIDANAVTAPLSRGRISVLIAQDAGMKNVRVVSHGIEAVDQKRLGHSLHGLADLGKLVHRTGREWQALGVMFRDQYLKATYWATAAAGDRWARAAAETIDAARRELAERDALTVLRDRHPSEYQDLVLRLIDRRTAP